MKHGIQCLHRESLTAVIGLAAHGGERLLHRRQPRSPGAPAPPGLPHPRKATLTRQE
jgi:hypothetical protein